MEEIRLKRVVKLSLDQRFQEMPIRMQEDISKTTGKPGVDNTLIGVMEGYTSIHIVRLLRVTIKG